MEIIQLGNEIISYNKIPSQENIFKQFLQKSNLTDNTQKSYMSYLRTFSKESSSLLKIDFDIFTFQGNSNDIIKIWDYVQENTTQNDKWKSDRNSVIDRFRDFQAKNESRDFENKNKPKGDTMKNQPLNQILYGPPGTGKTYHTIDKALEILGEDIKGKNREELREKFEEYKSQGQIEFITFHQSYSYEEFVEGIKPKIVKVADSNNDKKEMIYKTKSGIFKKICKEALKNLEDSKKTADELQAEKLLDENITNFFDELIDSGEEVEKTQGGKFQIESFIDENKLQIKTDDTIKSLQIDIKKFKQILNSKAEISTARDIARKVFTREYHKQTDTYYFQLLKRFKDFELQQPKKDSEKSERVSLKPYILIIDEINRGNISKILGELITLIEPSKRIGASDEEKERGTGNEALSVKLPYSSDDFGVPSNLYIIGTMNTADRSIALLDTALRRRFEFVEMMPDSSALKNKDIDDIDLVKLLESINNRIEFLLDREHTIGHAFFIGVNDLESLKNVFKTKIIPLLQEYFYDDYAKIDAVLNGNGMIKSFSMSDLKVNLGDDFVDSEKVIYKITDSKDWELWHFVWIYDKELGQKSKKDSQTNTESKE